jgi:integrase
LGYSAINTARCALSSLLHPFDGEKFGKHEAIKRLMLGLFNIRPTVPRYTHTWDVASVLSYLKTLRPLCELNLKMLTLKLAMLLLLVTGQRCQTIVNLDLQCLSEGTELIFTFNTTLKHSRPGKPGQTVVLTRYPHNVDLCVVTLLNEYIERTSSLRGEETKLLLSYVKPHRAITTDTFSRWIKTVMGLAGIDISKFKPHSSRSASTSKAQRSDVPVDVILKAAGWSNVETFRQFYDKPLHGPGLFADTVLRDNDDV